MTTPHHIAVIPARAGSKGLPGKNRALFGDLADFITTSALFDRVIVTTNDEELIKTAQIRGFDIRRRPDHLAGDHNSIREAFVDVVENCPVQPDDYLWLLFIPLVYRDVEDFKAARAVIDARQPAGLCSFIPAKTHPFNVWRIDETAGTVAKFIDNDYYNRQDYPPAWENYNYLCCVRVRDLPRANANLVCGDSHPVLLSPEKAAAMQEVDEPEDLLAWKTKHPEHFRRLLASADVRAWLDGLPETRIPKHLRDRLR
ncbi:MAG: hypothetical protein H7840_05425 [Alphaproteobacteria bacterium]